MSRRDELVVFLGPSLPAPVAERLAPCTVLPPARAGDVVAALAARPLAIALVDGYFETVPSVWHHELLEALEAGVAVFGGASLGALRAAELERHGMVGVGRIFRWVKSGVVEDDAEVALLHAPAEWGFRPMTLPLVNVRAAAEDARTAGALKPAEGRALVAAAEGIHFTERTWPGVIERAGLREAARERLLAFLPEAPDPKAEDAKATVRAAAEYVKARRAGAPGLEGPRRRPSTHLRRLKLDRSTAVVQGGAGVAARDVLDALAVRPDAGRLAADGVRRALVVALARSAGLEPGPGEADAALDAWLGGLGLRPGAREAFLATSALDAADVRRLAEDLALEAAVLADAARFTPDGPGWREGLALAARLSGAFAETAARLGKAPRAPAGKRARGRRR
ncbi:MAG: TfuA domain-containing protein [Anaeromyxobacteraceae bacterium]